MTFDLCSEEILLRIILISQSQKEHTHTGIEPVPQSESLQVKALFTEHVSYFMAWHLTAKRAELGLTTTSSIPTFRPPLARSPWPLCGISGRYFEQHAGSVRSWVSAADIFNTENKKQDCFPEASSVVFNEPTLSISSLRGGVVTTWKWKR